MRGFHASKAHFVHDHELLPPAVLPWTRPQLSFAHYKHHAPTNTSITGSAEEAPSLENYKNFFAMTHGISIPRHWKHLSGVSAAAAATAAIIVLPAPLVASGREGVEDVHALEFRHQHVGT